MNEQPLQSGSVVLVQFPFADRAASKLRPAIIINTDLPDSLLVLFVTSQHTFATNYDVALEPSEANGLKVPSIARANRLTVIATNHVDRAIGTLSRTEHDSVKTALMKVATDF